MFDQYPISDFFLIQWDRPSKDIILFPRQQIIIILHQYSIVPLSSFLNVSLHLYSFLLLSMVKKAHTQVMKKMMIEIQNGICLVMQRTITLNTDQI